jgi:transposase
MIESHRIIQPKKEESLMNVTTLGIDLAKNIFQLHGVNRHGQAVLTKRVTRLKLAETVANLPPCLIGLEACASSHYWARELGKLGHTVKLIAPQFVKPYVKSNKNDAADAEAICEAVARPNMRFVPVKTVAQQDIQAVHRVRERRVLARTALVNQIRGLLAEYGLVIPLKRNAVSQALPRILEDADNGLTALAREFVADLYEELQTLSHAVGAYDAKIERLFKANPVCQRLAKVEGVGPVTATALVAAGDAKVFRNGRQMAAWLGLVPRQYSSGGKQTLLGISKRGDTYLRTLLIHGARAAVAAARRKQDVRSRWITALAERRGANIAAVALANKNARVLWALMARGEEYRTAA